MRTAVVRINIDPQGVLAESTLRDRMAALSVEATNSGIEVEGMPGREIRFLVAGDDVAAMRATTTELCERVFGTTPESGVVTYVSRGTDDDALGVLAGFGLTGEVSRRPGDDGWDVVTVRLREADLERVPESRIHTALEASLNCEVEIQAD